MSGRPGGLRWRRYGDLGVLLELDDATAGHRWCAAVAAAGLDATARPGWASVLITSSRPVPELVAALEQLAPEQEPAAPAREHELPVTYDGRDLADVAERTGLTPGEVVRRHAGADYTVVCLGFARGFPYLAGLDPSLWLPRRDTPRVRVPAGSVAIASEQTGVYPQASPGGWHLLGRAQRSLFDAAVDPPSVLRPGDRVRFVPVPS